MLTRFAAVFLSLGLLGSAADARALSVPRPVAAPTEAVQPAVTRAAVRAALAQRRAKNIASFSAYRKGRVYPRNTWRPGPLNVWRDTAGHFCAAATMILKDGHKELVEATAKTSNNIRLLDVVEGPLLDWMLTSGLTIEEIDRIQMPAMDDRETSLEQETARLSRGYQQTERYLAKHAKAGLDTATDRLMKNPELAAKLLADT